MKYQDILKKVEELLEQTSEGAPEFKGLRYMLFALEARIDLEDASKDEIIKEIQSLVDYHNGLYPGLGDTGKVAGIEALLKEIR